MCYTNTRAAEFNKVSLQSLSLNQILNKVFMQTFVLCLEVRDGKQETREWGVADLTGSKDGERDAGGLEGSTSLRFSSSSSPSLQSAPDRRSLIGNEPWSRSLSRDQQIATTYRLWRGDSSTPPPSLSLYHPFASPSLFILLSQCLWGVYDLSRAVSGSGPRWAGEYFTAPDVSNAPLTLFLPGLALTCQDWLIHLEWSCSLHCTDSVFTWALLPPPIF